MRGPTVIRAPEPRQGAGSNLNAVTDTPAQRPAKLWTPPFIAAVVVNLFMSSVFYLLLTSMAGYSIEMFAASDAMAGMASAGFILGAVASRLVVGKFLDFIGRRRLVLFAMIGYIIIGLAYIPVTNLGLLIALRLLHGVVFGAGSTALVASVQSVIPNARRSEGNGYFAMATTLSTALGPFLAVWLSQTFGFESVFLVSALMGGFGLIAGFFFTVAERTPSAVERAQMWSLNLGTFIDRGGLGIGVVIGVAGFAYVSVMSFLAVYTEELGIPESASMYFVAYAVASLVARLVTGRIQDRFGDNVVVIPVLILNTIGMVLVAQATSPFMIVLAGVFVGLGFGSLMPSLLAVVVNLSSPARVGVTTSTFYLFLDLGSGLGPILLGYAVTAFGFSAMFLIGAGLAVVSGVLYMLVHGRTPAARRRPA